MDVTTSRVSKARSASHPGAGFTLIELLVVIAIIAILAAILFPVFAQARDKARQTACLSNLKQIGTGMMMYVQDFDETYPGALQAEQTINSGSTSDMRKPLDMQLAPYIKNDDVWHCPSDDAFRVGPGDGRIQWWDGNYKAKGILRSYMYMSEINTEDGPTNARNPNTGLSNYTGSKFPNGTPAQGKALADLTEPSNTIALVEGWASAVSDWANLGYVGSPHASTAAGCDTWKLAGRKMTATSVQGTPDSLPLNGGCNGRQTWEPTKGHADGSNYVLADGSAKFRRWPDVRRNDFYMFKLKKPTTTLNP